MLWYGGNIAEAVNLSKQRNAIFVVFVEGDNDLSNEMAATINDSAIVTRLSNETNFLAVKLQSSSPNYTHFAQIYQFVPVPSLFFIDRNGVPLEVVCAGVEASNLASRIDRILEEHHKATMSSVQPSTSSHNIKEHTTNLLQSEAAANVANTAPNVGPNAANASQNVNVGPNVPANVATTVAANASSNVATNIGPNVAANVSPNVTVKSNAEISQPTTKKSFEESPESSSGPALKVQKTEHHEVTRSGQEYDVVCDGDVCIRKPRADQAGPSQTEPAKVEAQPVSINSPQDIETKVDHAKVLIEAKRKEKAEKEKELEKQKELERRALGQGVAELKRWQADQELKQIQEERKREKKENMLARQRILEQIAQDRAETRARDVTPASPLPSQPTQTSGDDGSRSRIQFKLQDGTSHVANFSADDTVAHIRQYVVDNILRSVPSFSLWTAFPRRELTDPEATLRGLDLVPSGALLLMPRVVSAPVDRPPAYTVILTFFSHFFTSLIIQPSQQFYSWIRGWFSSPRAREDTPSDPQGRPPPPGLRRRGNVHRLPGDSAGDDDNNTWNGNSTQQM